MLLPKLTLAVTGPAAQLLTNLDGFHCRFSINFGAPGQDELTVNGDLLSAAVNFVLRRSSNR